MLDAWRAFLRDATTPDAFPDKPVEALANQFGHVGSGALAAAGAFYGILWLTDVIAGKAILLTLAVLPGAIVEARQGWRGADTAWDLWFRLIGILAIYLPLTETSVPGLLEPGPPVFFAVLAAGAVSLAAHLAPRVQRRYGAD